MPSRTAGATTVPQYRPRGTHPQAPASVLHMTCAHTTDEIGQPRLLLAPSSLGGRPRAPEMAMPGSVPSRRLWLSIPSPARWPVLQWCWMTWQRQATCDFKGMLSATDFLKGYAAFHSTVVAL